MDAEPALTGFVALNAVVQAAGYLMIAFQVIALVRYHDGRQAYAVEDWLLRGMLLQAPLLPGRPAAHPCPSTLQRRLPLPISLIPPTRGFQLGQQTAGKARSAGS